MDQGVILFQVPAPSGPLAEISSLLTQPIEFGAMDKSQFNIIIVIANVFIPTSSCSDRKCRRSR